MGELRFFAVGIDEVRDVFAASEELRERLRQSATRRLKPPEPPRIGLLGKLGPMFRKPLNAPAVNPAEPTAADIENVLSGRFVAPERSDAAWALLRDWLAELAWGTTADTMTPDEMSALDFDLARAGMSSQYGFAKLLNAELGIPLRPARGLSTGYIKHHQVANLTHALEHADEQLESANAERVRRLTRWLHGFPHWAEVAPGAGRPEPDLVVLYQA